MQAQPQLRYQSSRRSTRFEGPFGCLEQRELQALMRLGARHPHVAALVALRVRESGQSGWVGDGIPSLARWACMSQVTMQRALKFLIQHGIVDAQPPRPRSGGARGSWVSLRRARRFAEWPEDVRTRIESHGHPSLARGSTRDETAVLEVETTSQCKTDTLTLGPRPVHFVPRTPDTDQILPDEQLKAAADALTRLRYCGWYPYEEKTDDKLLHRFQVQRPLVDVAIEVERFLRKVDPTTVRSPRKALGAWLERARDTGRTERDRYCTQAECLGRGRGSSGLCVVHLGIAG